MSRDNVCIRSSVEVEGRGIAARSAGRGYTGRRSGEPFVCGEKTSGKFHHRTNLSLISTRSHGDTRRENDSDQGYEQLGDKDPTTAPADNPGYPMDFAQALSLLSSRNDQS